MKTSLFLSTAITALLVTGAASAEKKIYAALDIAGDHEIPAVESAATAKAIFSFDSTTKKLCGKITTTPSTFNADKGVHLHEGDDKADDGKIIVDLNDGKGFTGELNVDLELTDEQVTAITTGDTYINLHTTANPAGEIRDQLVEDDAQEDPCPDGADAGASSSSGGASSSGTGTGTSSGGSKDGGASSSSGSAAAADSTDDGGCNTTGSSSGNALALLAGLGIVVAAASRKRKKA